VGTLASTNFGCGICSTLLQFVLCSGNLRQSDTGVKRQVSLLKLLPNIALSCRHPKSHAVRPSSDGEWSLTIVDKKPGDVSTCVDTDADWGIPTEDPYPQAVSCQQLILLGICENGEIDLLFAELYGFLPDVDVAFGATNETMSEACCACGGGIPSDDLSETLFEWQLVIYGRDANVTTPESSKPPDDTTPEPTELPSVLVPPKDCQSIGKTWFGVKEEVVIAFSFNETKFCFFVCQITGELVCTTDFLSILCDAVALAELDGPLSEGNWTVFAPTDNAIVEVLESGLLARSEVLEPLQELLLFHVTSGFVYKIDLTCSGLVPMVRHESDELF
jgi:hypothetical protein